MFNYKYPGMRTVQRNVFPQVGTSNTKVFARGMTVRRSNAESSWNAYLVLVLDASYPYQTTPDGYYCTTNATTNCIENNEFYIYLLLLLYIIQCYNNK